MVPGGAGKRTGGGRRPLGRMEVPTDHRGAARHRTARASLFVCKGGDMLINLILIACGFALLIVGANALVDGAAVSRGASDSPTA